MAYATVQDLVDRFGAVELAQLTDRAAGATLDSAVAQRALDDASGEMDSYLGARYSLPLGTTPAVLKAACSDIARYRLYEDRATEEVRSRYEDARAWLRDLAKGLASLDLGPASATPPANRASFQATGRIFTRGSLSDL